MRKGKYMHVRVPLPEQRKNTFHILQINNMRIESVQKKKSGDKLLQLVAHRGQVVTLKQINTCFLTEVSSMMVSLLRTVCQCISNLKI